MKFARNNCLDCGNEVHSIATSCKRCRACMNKKQRESNAKYREKRKNIPKTPKQRYDSYRRGAINRNYAFELTEEQFMTFWDKDCYYCKQTINGIGIDRVDNAIGYVIGNCVPCCKTCNWMKQSLSHNHFIAKCIQIAKAHSIE
jgi:hypothetical protein